MVIVSGNFPQIVEHLTKTGIYGLDTEAFGLLWDDRLFSVIISDEDEDYYFDFLQTLPRDLIPKLQPIFSNPTSTFYGHNAKFDWNMLSKEGISITANLYCTLSNERIIKNNHMDMGLDNYTLRGCAKRSLGLNKSTVVDEYLKEHKLYEKTKIPGKKKVNEKPRMDKVPLPIMAEYGCKDARLHRALGIHQQAKLDDLSKVFGANSHAMQPLTSVALNEQRLIRTCQKMEERGVSIDINYTKQALSHESALVDQWKQKFYTLTGLPFEDGRTTLVAAFEKLGLNYPRTEKGNPSFSDDALDTISGELPDVIRNIRRYEKRVGTYYSSFLHFLSKDGKIHPNMKPAGTETGRFSYSDPNFQNVPKEDDEDFQVRGCIIPSPENCLVSIDYKQQEFRMLLDYAGEHQLIKAVNDGADVHQATAEITGLSRSQAKNVGFAALYGAGTPKLAKMIGVTESQAQAMKDQFFGRLPGVKRFMNQVQRAGKVRGYIRNWFGRVCYLSDPQYSYILVNHLIQGGGADVIKLAMNQIDGLNAPLILQVHDELLFDMTEEQLDMVPEITKIMESIYKPQNGMILHTSCSYSYKSWSHNDKTDGTPSKTQPHPIRTNMAGSQSLQHTHGTTA